MANYTVEQFYQMIDDCYTPEFLMMEKAMERQRYVDIFTEMHNYISENIIELPFDAEVFTEEDQKDNIESKSVWDKNDKGWGGFWRNVGRVIANIWRNFWRFIKSLGSFNDNIKPQEAQQIADRAEAVAKDVEQASEQEVQQAIEQNPEPVKEAATTIKDILEMFEKNESYLTRLEDGLAKIKASKLNQTQKDNATTEVNKRIKAAAAKMRNNDEYKNYLEKVIQDPKSVDRGKLLKCLSNLESFFKTQVDKGNIDGKRCKSICLLSMASLDLYVNILKQQSALNKMTSASVKTGNVAAKTFFENQDVYKKLYYNVASSVDLVKLYIDNKTIISKNVADAITLSNSSTQIYDPTKGLKTYQQILEEEANKIFKNYSDIYDEAAKVQTTGGTSKGQKFSLPTKATYDSGTGETTNIDENKESSEITNLELSSDFQSIQVGGESFQTIIMGIVSMSKLPMDALGLLGNTKDRAFASLLNKAINAISKSMVTIKSK